MFPCVCFKYFCRLVVFDWDISVILPVLVVSFKLFLCYGVALVVWYDGGLRFEFYFLYFLCVTFGVGTLGYVAVTVGCGSALGILGSDGNVVLLRFLIWW